MSVSDLTRLCNRDLLSILDLCQESLSCDKNTLPAFLNKLNRLHLPSASILAAQINIGTNTGRLPSYDLINLSYPAEWLEEYLQNDYFTIDPIKKQMMAKNNIHMCHWSETLKHSSDTRYQHFVRRLHDHKLDKGLTIFHRQNKNRSISFFSFGGCEVELDQRSHAILGYMLPYLHEAFNRDFTESLAPSKTESTSTVLTPREQDVLNWAMYGKTNTDIGTLLNISERTVKFHIQNIMSKLNASNRAHAVTIALHQGMISG